MMKDLKKIICVILTVAMVLVSFPLVGFAAEQENRLTICYRHEGTSLTGVNFSLYQVASIDADHKMTVKKEFQRFQIRNDESWDILAQTLEVYAMGGQIAPLKQDATDENGMIVFSGLEHGVYLVSGSFHFQNGVRFESVPFLVTVDPKETEKEYNVVAYPKYDADPADEEDTVTRKVLKVWADSGAEKKRPKEIFVQLLCDGKHYATVVLSESNQWRYTWEELDGLHRWTVTEKEPGGYTVRISREGITFVVTNTYTKGPDPTPGPTKPPTLPKTGQTWWPVPLLLALGTALIIMGLRKRGA